MLYILPPPTQSNPPSPWDLIINYHRTNGDPTTSPNDENSVEVEKPLQHSHTKLIKSKFTMFENLQNHPQIQDRLEKYKSNRSNNHVRRRFIFLM